jgi:hypothetical protein
MRCRFAIPISGAGSGGVPVEFLRRERPECPHPDRASKEDAAGLVYLRPPRLPSSIPAVSKDFENERQFAAPVGIPREVYIGLLARLWRTAATLSFKAYSESCGV